MYKRSTYAGCIQLSSEKSRKLPAEGGGPEKIFKKNACMLMNSPHGAIEETMVCVRPESEWAIVCSSGDTIRFVQPAG
jgi:hypothetical protein